MRFDEVFPSLMAGRAIRRRAWDGKRHLAYQDSFLRHKCVTRFEFATEGSWPSPRELSDILEEDWEVMPSRVLDPKLPSSHQMALEVMTAKLSESEASEGMGTDELALSAVTALVQLRNKDGVDEQFNSLREGAVKSFLALATFLSQKENSERRRM